jgi:hypothetical protein
MKLPNEFRHRLNSRKIKKAAPETVLVLMAPTPYDPAKYALDRASIRLTVDNEIKAGSYWARQSNPKSCRMIVDTGTSVDVPMIGAELDTVLEAARKTDRKPWWNESQQRWYVGADTAEAWANINR